MRRKIPQRVLSAQTDNHSQYCEHTFLSVIWIIRVTNNDTFLKALRGKSNEASVVFNPSKTTALPVSCDHIGGTSIWIWSVWCISYEGGADKSHPGPTLLVAGKVRRDVIGYRCNICFQCYKWVWRFDSDVRQKEHEWWQWRSKSRILAKQISISTIIMDKGNGQ